jgi:hypothetical protein
MRGGSCTQVCRSCQALGLLLGHALVWGKMLTVNLNPVFLKLVLGRQVLLVLTSYQWSCPLV